MQLVIVPGGLASLMVSDEAVRLTLGGSLRIVGCCFLKRCAIQLIIRRKIFGLVSLFAHLRDGVGDALGVACGVGEADVCAASAGFAWSKMSEGSALTCDSATDSVLAAAAIVG